MASAAQLNSHLVLVRHHAYNGAGASYLSMLLASTAHSTLLLPRTPEHWPLTDHNQAPIAAGKTVAELSHAMLLLSSLKDRYNHRILRACLVPPKT